MPVHIIKELWAQKALVLFSICMMLILICGLSVVQIYDYPYEICSMDAFAFSSEYMPVSVFIISIFLSISLNKDNFKTDRVVLSQKASNVWNYTVLKTVVMSAVMSALIFAFTFILGVLCFGEFYNWDKPESLFFIFTGCSLESLNFGMLFAAYFFQCFYGILTASIVPLLTYWCFKTYVAGAFAAAVFFLGGTISGMAFIWNQNIFYGNILKGFDIRYHYVYPLIAVIILALSGSFKQQRDFLK